MSLADIIPILLLVIGGLLSVANLIKKNQKQTVTRKVLKPASLEQQTIQDIQADIPEQDIVQTPEPSTQKEHEITTIPKQSPTIKKPVTPEHKLTKKKVKDAIIWMEVLGKPRALNPHEITKRAFYQKK